MNLIPLYNQQYAIKHAGVIQRGLNVYNDLKDKIPRSEGEPMSVGGQTAVGAGLGAGLGGLGVAAGEGLNRAVLKQPEVLGYLKQMHPNITGILGGMRKSPLAAMAIPAGLLALIAGMRARSKQ